MDEMKLVIVGAAGRMGRTLVKTVCETDGAVVTHAIEHKKSQFIGQDAGELAGIGPIGVEISADPVAALAGADGVIDFTSPGSSMEIAALAAQARIVHVIGTTGFTAADEDNIAAAARHAVIVKSGNMSLGVNLLSVLVQQAAKALPKGFDIEILEMHHRHKVDAPSGTALLLGQAAAAGRGIDLAEHSVRVRDGQTGPRTEDDIGFAALRGGSVVGDHSVIFAGPGERIEISHRAEDRTIFARGAVAAVLWGWHKNSGLYSMTDVLGLNQT
ncbi:MAG: 4-hydroxy-tetrahydrodipicolinate reductase [Fimbriimonadaceae bacterium]|nr:4-hydroxy-tetrahydrodipicolinate reductase [Alphaproteobacteria bacterium]